LDIGKDLNLDKLFYNHSFLSTIKAPKYGNYERIKNLEDNVKALDANLEKTNRLFHKLRHDEKRKMDLVLHPFVPKYVSRQSNLHIAKMPRRLESFKRMRTTMVKGREELFY